YRELFALSQQHLPYLRTATIRAIVLVESLPCVYQMEEMLYELGPYAAGLNAARWDLKASIFEFVMTDPRQVWPDRFGVDIKTTPFLADIFRRLVAICQKRGAVPVGGMATALPSNDPEVNRVAGEAIRKDKEWEAAQGFIRAWVAHIFHMKTAADPFRRLHTAGAAPAPGTAKPESYPLRVELADILARRPKHADVEARYRKAVKIGMRWVKNYTELDFRSLGSYSRAELDAIAAAPDALLSVSGPRRPVRGRGSTARRRRRSSGP